MSALKITATAKPIMAPIIISFTSISKPRRETGSTAAGVVTSGATVTAMANDRMILTLAGTVLVPNTGAMAIMAAMRASGLKFWPTRAVNSVMEKFMGGATRYPSICGMSSMSRWVQLTRVRSIHGPASTITIMVTMSLGMK